MTIIDLFISWPLWVRIVVGGVFLIWAIESLLLPFKINMTYNTLKRVETLLGQILSQTKVNKVLNEDSQKILSLVLGSVGKKEKDK